MWLLLTLIVAIIGIDLYVDWVTPYLRQVERERGGYVALAEALRILQL